MASILANATTLVRHNEVRQLMRKLSVISTDLSKMAALIVNIFFPTRILAHFFEASSRGALAAWLPGCLVAWSLRMSKRGKATEQEKLTNPIHRPRQQDHVQGSTDLSSPVSA